MSLNPKFNSFVNATSETVTIALKFGCYFGCRVKRGMVSFGACAIEK